MDSNTKVTAVLINYKTPNMTVECAKNLMRQSYTNFDLIIVDNASSDNSLDILKALEGPKCHIIASRNNLGFSYGNNLGLRYALDNGADKILFINNDTESDINLVSILEERCDEHTITIPKTYYFADRSLLWDTGFDVTRFGRFFNRGLGERDRGQYDRSEEVPLFSGHCLMVHRETIKKVGEWDESYFMYHEDTDYAQRMIQAGNRILYLPEAKLWHKVGLSGGGGKNPQMMYYVVRNRLHYLREYKCPILWKIRNRIWVSSLIIRYRYMRQNQYQYVLKALKDYNKGLMGKVEF